MTFLALVLAALFLIAPQHGWIFILIALGLGILKGIIRPPRRDDDVEVVIRRPSPRQQAPANWDHIE